MSFIKSGCSEGERNKHIFYLKNKIGGSCDYHDSLCINLDTGELYLKLEISSNERHGEQSCTTLTMNETKQKYPQYFNLCMDFFHNYNFNEKNI